MGPHSVDRVLVIVFFYCLTTGRGLNEKAVNDKF